VISGANDRVRGPAPAANVSIWVTQAEIPVEAVVATLETARASGATALVNPAPAGRLPADLVARFDIVVVNESELEALGGQHAPVTVLTLGAAGARLLPDGPVLPALPAQAVDTTGAGDALVGVMAAGLAEGMPVERALRFGMAAAALAVESPGCQPAMPARDRIDARVAAAR
jgi:ribokinase